MRRLSTSVLFLVVVFCGVYAQAFSISLNNNYPLRWPQRSVSVWLDHDGSKDLSGTIDLDAVRRGMASWNDLTCSDWQFVEAGFTTQTDTILTTNRTDGQNRVVWIDDRRWQYGAYVLGVTTPVFDNYGRISEADISFNGYQTRWSVDGSATDVESVAVHEFGHFFGLQHVLGGENMSDPPTMAPAVDPRLRTRTLTNDDKAGLCFLYPTTRYTCAGLSDCPKLVDTNDSGEEYYTGQLSCQNNQCTGIQQLEPGSKQLGERCDDPTSCIGSLFCQATNLGSYCTQQCTPNVASSCPSGFTCWPYSGGGGGACMPNSLNTGGTTGGTSSGATTGGPVGGSTGGGNTQGSTGGDNSGGDSGGSTGTTTTPPADDCACDTHYSCQADCECDPECYCACDTTTVCNDNCECDPECGSGCAAVVPEKRGLESLGWLLLTFLALGIWRRATAA